VPPNYPLTDRLHSIYCNPALAGGDRMQFDQLKRRDFITLPGTARQSLPIRTSIDEGGESCNGVSLAATSAGGRRPSTPRVATAME